jgi:hypothetical protein
MNECSKCGGSTVFKSGTSQKTGKPYSGYKCTACDNFDFQRRVSPPQQSAPRPQPQAPQSNTRLELLKLAVQAAMKDERPTVEAIAYYLESLQKILKGDFLVQDSEPLPSEDIPF